MSNEKKDEFLSWRGILDSPEGVPGQGLDNPEQTWERLMDRFREKPRRCLPVYGIVAACLLLALIPASRLFQDRKQQPHPAGIRQATPLVVRPEGGPQVITSSSPSAPAARLAEEQVRKQGDGPTNRTVGGPSKASARTEMRTVVVTDDTVHSLQAPAAPLVSQIPPATPVPQKKWKVVDLNDLHAGWQTPQRMASNQSEPSFRIRLGKTDPSGDQMVPTSPSGDQGIKIKFYTSN